MFDVRFRDFHVNIEFYYNRDKTLCLIQSVDDPESIRVGTASRNPGDAYKKSIGQKVALTDALKPYFSKDFRAVVWEKYLKTYKSLFLEEMRENEKAPVKEELTQPTYYSCPREATLVSSAGVYYGGIFK